MSSNREYVSFTLDLKELGRAISNDPTARAELIAGLAEGAGKPTAKLGAANFGTQEEPKWCSLFMSTDREKQPGTEGYIYRSRDKKRIQMRLKMQPEKTQAATVGAKLTDEQTQLVAKLINAGVSPEQAAKVAFTAIAPVAQADDGIPADLRGLV